MKSWTTINQIDVLFAVWSKMKKMDLPTLYRIPKLYIYFTKHLYIAEFVKHSTKFLSQLHVLTSIISVDKNWHQTYRDNRYSRCDINQRLRLLIICFRTNKQSHSLHAAQLKHCLPFILLSPILS